MVLNVVVTEVVGRVVGRDVNVGGHHKDVASVVVVVVEYIGVQGQDDVDEYVVSADK